MSDAEAAREALLQSARADEARRLPSPAVMLDQDGNINLFWVAGARQVEIVFAAEGSIYARIRNEQGDTTLNEEGPLLRTAPVAAALTEMARAIAARDDDV